MLLILMRHGIAEELREGQTDAERALTADGKKKSRAALRGLRALLQNIDCMATSPKMRALQTAKIAAEVFESTEPEIWPELENAEYSALVERFKTMDAPSVLLVGHEPGFSNLAARLLTGKESGLRMEFKKSGVCVLDGDWSTPKPRATLLWHLSPKQLRLIGKSQSAKFSHHSKTSAKR